MSIALKATMSYIPDMDNSAQEWSAPSVEALTQADGIDEASQVEFRNGESGGPRR